MTDRPDRPSPPAPEVSPSTPARMSGTDFDALYRSLRAQAADGADPRRGALAHLTPERVVAAAGEVRTGRAVSLAAPVDTAPGPDNPQPATHRLTAPADGEDLSRGLHFARDRFAMNVHGDADSHLDALCHVMFEGELYGGVPAAAVTAGRARPLTLDLVADGIVGRGVLLDVPRLRGVPWLEPGDQVSAEELEAAADAEGVTVGPGDLLFVRVGHRARRRSLGAWDAAGARAGLHPRALRFPAGRKVAVLGSDGNNDAAPSAVPEVAFPVHVLAVQALGVHLLDYLDLEELASLCARLARWHFLCVVAPLRLAGATGCPVNPIAVL